jgi:hypothetical protein
MKSLQVGLGLFSLACLLGCVPADAVSTVTPPSPDLLAVKNVYIMPMRSGFDQYLANELTSHGVMRVVTDPRRADAVVTDHLGESFQQRMDDLFPAPVKPKPQTESKEGDTKAEGDAKVPDKDQLAVQDEPEVDSRPVSSGANGKGNVFLVGRDGRAVIWSDFRPPRSHQPKDMKRAADSVASDLKRALQPPESGPKQ